MTGPIFKKPKSKPDWHGPDALKELQQHLQTAVLVELYTIPLYLFAAYSVKKEESANSILSVVKQEMLHLGLAGNILCAIRGQPRLYGDAYTPGYPVGVFYEERKITLELKPATRDNIAIFTKLEEPLNPTDNIMLFAPRDDILQDYKSIGEFYQATLEGLEIVANNNKDLFDQSSISRQFQTSDGSWFDDDMTVILDLKSAATAMTLIIEQGEGSTGMVPIPNLGQSHYEIFKELRDDSIKHPLDCYPVVNNPVTEKYKDLTIYKVLLASDAAYSYLLLTLEKMWEYSGEKRGALITTNIMQLMFTLIKPLALFLVTQPLENGDNAAPPFNIYKFKEGSSAFEQLKVLTGDALKAYPDVVEVKQAKEGAETLIDISTL